jgi:hypothetical protein
MGIANRSIRSIFTFIIYTLIALLFWAAVVGAIFIVSEPFGFGLLIFLVVAMITSMRALVAFEDFISARRSESDRDRRGFDVVIGPASTVEATAVNRNRDE